MGHPGSLPGGGDLDLGFSFQQISPPNCICFKYFLTYLFLQPYFVKTYLSPIIGILINWGSEIPKVC